MIHLPRSPLPLHIMDVLISRPFNLLIFNLLWLGCVIGRADWLIGVAPVALAYAAVLVATGTVRLQQILLPACIGLTLDSIMVVSGLLRFDETSLLLPLWLAVLWVAFSTTLTRSLQIFGHNKWIAALAGGIAFPVNYGVGERLGAVSFHDTYFLTVLALAITWAVFLPVLYLVVENSWRWTNATG